MTVSAEENLQLGIRQRHGRAINAVAEFLRYKFPKLSVPNIYIEPRISPLTGIDLLAIDRAGSGDLHVVEIKEAMPLSSSVQFDRLVEQVKKYPAHFKYIAIPQPANPARLSAHAKLFAKNGIGRVGIIFLEQNGGDLPKVTLFSPAERFQVDGNTMEKLERTLTKQKPDIEVRI